MNDDGKLRLRYTPQASGYKSVTTTKGVFERFQTFGFVKDEFGDSVLVNCESDFGFVRNRLSLEPSNGQECVIVVSGMDSKGAILTIKFADIEPVPSELKRKQS